MRPLITLKAKFPTLSRSTRYRWRRSAHYKLPAPAKVIGGIEYYNADELDAWEPPPGPTAEVRTARLTPKQRPTATAAGTPTT
jgi:hypothetical protein